MALKTRYSPLQHFSMDNLFAAFSELPAVQKAIALGVIGLLLVLVVFFPISIFSGKASSMKKEISSAQKGYQQVIDKISDYQKAKSQIETLESQFSHGGGGALTTRIESLAKQSGLTVDQVHDDPPQETDYLEINSLEVKLSNVNLSQLLDLVYNLENDKTAPLRVRKIQIKPRSNNRQILDVTFHVATFSVKKET